MRKDNARQRTREGAGKTTNSAHTADAANTQAADEIAALFARIVANGYQPRMRAISGTCRFNLAGAGSWLATVKDGVPFVVRDDGKDTATPDCAVACDAEDFLRVAHREGNLNIFAAFLQGRVTISGNIGFATALLGSVTVNSPDAVGAPPQQAARGSQPREGERHGQ